MSQTKKQRHLAFFKNLQRFISLGYDISEKWENNENFSPDWSPDNGYPPELPDFSELISSLAQWKEAQYPGFILEVILQNLSEARKCLETAGDLADYLEPRQLEELNKHWTLSEDFNDLGASIKWLINHYIKTHDYKP